MKTTIAIFMLGFIAVADAKEHVTSGQRLDVATVRRVEHDWSIAEMEGDIDYLRDFLSADFRAVNTEGRVRDREAIFAHARTFKQEHPGFVLPPDQDEVRLFGNTAIVTRITMRERKEGGTAKIFDADCLVFDGKRWHAVFAQQTLMREP